MSKRSPLWRYGSATLFVAAAIALRFWLDPIMGGRGVVIFVGAILAGAWTGGVGPAILCLVVLHGIHAYGYENPPRLFGSSASSFISIAAYYVVGIMVGALSQMRSAAMDRARAANLEATAQRERLSATLSCMAEAVIVTDTAGRVTLMNRAAELLTGFETVSVQTRPWSAVIALAQEDGAVSPQDPIAKTLLERRIVRQSSPMLLSCKTGVGIPISYSAAPIQAEDGAILGAVLVMRDESERRRAERALQEADRHKDEFLATLAHELRNPLAPICMGVELLARAADDERLAEETRLMIERQARHMVRLIDDLLDVSRITRGKLELRKSRVELSQIVRDAAAAVQPMVEQLGHRLSIRLPEAPVALDADASRLTQIVTNLLHNAAKYTPAGGRIDLAVERQGADLVVSVCDTGIGVPADKLSGVFEMFTQFHGGQERGHAGLGIGLALVKRLVELHGGRIEAHSRGENLGATFVARLPVIVAASDHRASEPNETDGRGPTRRRVLVADDNLDALESLSRLVALMGNDVRKARDGLEAVELAEAFKPEIILMDLGMPTLNGFGAARRIREAPWGSAIVLAATTGWGQDEDRRRTAEAGFDYHLVKPLDIGLLRQVFDAAPGAPSEGSPPQAALTFPTQNGQ